jgi:putative ABC transport system permease protein
MNPLLSARIALRALWTNPLRSGLTMLGVIIGVAAIITMVAVGAGAQARVAEQMRILGSNLLVVGPGSATAGGVRLGYGTQPTITEEDSAAIAREIPAVEVVAGSVWATGCCRIVYESQNWWTGVQGIVPEYESIRQWTVVRGRYIARDDETAAAKVALFGQTAAAKLFGPRDPVGEVVRIGQVPFTVIGVLSPRGQSSGGRDQDDVVLIPRSTAKLRIIGRDNPRADIVHTITVKLREGTSTKSAVDQIRALLRQRHRLPPSQDDDFRVQDLSEMLQAEQESTRAFTVLLAAVASVSLLVGGIGIMNIMLVSVTERTREIGIRMAVGARTTDILTQFLVESVTLALIGGAIGILLGVGGAYAISYFARWRTLVAVEPILLAVGFAVAIGVFFGLYPARRAAALDPIHCLRHE